MTAIGQKRTITKDSQLPGPHFESLQETDPEMATQSNGSRWEELAALPFPNGYPTEEARALLLEEHYFERAVQVYLGALPAVNMMALKDGSESQFGARRRRAARPHHRHVHRLLAACAHLCRHRRP